MLCSLVEHVADAIMNGGTIRVGGRDVSMKLVLLLSLIFILTPFDPNQMIFAALGALAYAALKALPVPVTHQVPRPRQVHPAYKARNSANLRASRCQQTHLGDLSSQGASATEAVPQRIPNSTWTLSARSQLAPVFSAQSFGAQVDELLEGITPSIEIQRAVQGIVAMVEHIVQQVIPEAHVVGYCKGGVVSNSWFGVAVPEVDIVAYVSYGALSVHFKERSGAGTVHEGTNKQRMQKNALRRCMNRLLAKHTFKYRRSAVHNAEPKFTLLAQVGSADCPLNVPFDFSVNTSTPQRHAALLADCGKLDPRTKLLSLLVRRWAKDRGISHVAKGHLSPYAWTLLVVHFLQGDVAGEGPILPPLEYFPRSSALMGGKDDSLDAFSRRSSTTDRRNRIPGVEKSVGELFREFVHFYNGLNLQSGIALIRQQQELVDLPTQSSQSEDANGACVFIEDPFEPTLNAAEGMSSDSFARLTAELGRAEDLLVRNSSLTKLLEIWYPEVTEEEQSSSTSAESDDQIED